MELLETWKPPENSRSPSIIFLMEIKQSQTQMETIRHQIGFTFYFTVNSIGKSGGLALLWNEEVPIEIVKFSNYYIHSKIIEKATGVEWCLTRFYGIPKTSKRSDYWALLDRINQSVVEFWCLRGDFNEKTTQDKKKGGRPRPQEQMEDFKLALGNNGFIDMR